MSEPLHLLGQQLTPADWSATPESVKWSILVQLSQQINQLEQANQQLRTRVTELEERLNRNSKNSSQPPSQDAPQAKSGKGDKGGFGKSNRPPQTRRTRQQPQHPLSPPEACQSIHEQIPSNCSGCGHPLSGEDETPHRHQVVDLPPIIPAVTEYRLHRLRCSHCGATTRGQLPSGVSERCYGERLAGIVALLSGEYRQSHRQVSQLLSAVFSIRLSRQSINRARQEVSAAVTQSVSQAHQYVQQQRFIHSDETRFPQGNQDQRNPQRQQGWLWVLVTPLVRVFSVVLSRSKATAQTLIGKAFSGYLISDRYSSYNWVALSQRQVCWAHLLRDLQAIAERQGVSQNIGEALLRRAYRLFHWWHRVRDGTMSRDLLMDAVNHLRSGFKTELEEAAHLPLAKGEKTPLAKTIRTCQQLLKLEEALWTFVYQPGLEPTNNQAERALRPAVIWRRLSFGSQSKAGSDFVARMLTVNATLKAQERSVLDFLADSCRAARRGLTGPSLLPERLDADVPSTTILAIKPG
jgi:transposase